MSKPIEAKATWHRLGDKKPPYDEVVPIAPAKATRQKVDYMSHQGRTWFDPPYSLPASDDDLWCELEWPKEEP